MFLENKKMLVGVKLQTTNKQNELSLIYENKYNKISSTTSTDRMCKGRVNLSKGHNLEQKIGEMSK